MDRKESHDASSTEDSFVPLRKKLRREDTGEEHNFMPSYYVEAASVRERTGGEVVQMRHSHGIAVDGTDVPRPIKSFQESGLPHWILELLRARGVHTPTPIQMQAIPCALSGRDLVGQAETGSGKTLAYVLPLLTLLQQVAPARPGQGPVALVLAPTRELVEQTYTEVMSFLVPPTGHRALGVVGGVPLATQTLPLQQGIDVLLATPGRLLDLMDRGMTGLDRVIYLVLDEADRMLSMGMEEQLRRIMTYASVQVRQTLLWSATFPVAVERLVRSSVLNPVYIRVGDPGVTAQSVEQHVIFVHTSQKKAKLLEVLRSIDRPPVLLFCNTTHGVDRVVGLLRKEHFHVAGLHGDKPQAYRFRVMQLFREGKVDVLVATDVASRGIDVTEITHVIVYDMPHSIDDYVHRVGRTGRAGRVGHATAFLTLDCTIAGELRQMLLATKQHVPEELMSLRRFGAEVVHTELGDVAQY